MNEKLLWVMLVDVLHEIISNSAIYSKDVFDKLQKLVDQVYKEAKK